MTLVKPSDPQVVWQQTFRFAAFFLCHDKVFQIMQTRVVNEAFDSAIFDDMFHRLSPKITAF